MVDTPKNPFETQVQISQEPYQTGEIGAGISPPSRFTQWVNQVGYNFDTSISGRADNYIKRSQIQAQEEELNQTKLELAELRQMAPDVNWEGPQYKKVADFMIDEERSRKATLDYIARGKPTGFMFELTAGVPLAVEPANLTASFLTAGLLNPVVKRLGITAASSFWSRFALNAADGTLGNLMADVPNVALARHYLGSNESMKDQIAGDIGAGIGFAALGSVLKYAKDYVVGRFSKKVVDSAMKSHILANETNTVHPNTALWMGNAENDGIHGNTNTPDAPSYRDLEHPSEAPFFVNDVSEGQIESDGAYGRGVYLTDSGVVSNNKGDFFQASVAKETKFFKPEKVQQDSPEFSVVASKLQEKWGRKLPFDSTKNAQDFFKKLEALKSADQIPDTYKNDVQQVLREMGYGGIVEAHTVNGNKRHNKLFVFSQEAPSVLAKEGFFKSNEAIRPKVNANTMEAQARQLALDSAKKKWYDIQAVAELEQLKQKPEWTPEQVKSFIREYDIRTSAELKMILEDLKQLQLEFPEAPPMGGRKLEAPTKQLLLEDLGFKQSADGQLEFDMSKAPTPEKVAEQVQFNEMKQLSFEGMRGLDSTTKKKAKTQELRKIFKKGLDAKKEVFSKDRQAYSLALVKILDELSPPKEQLEMDLSKKMPEYVEPTKPTVFGDQLEFETLLRESTGHQMDLGDILAKEYTQKEGPIPPIAPEPQTPRPRIDAGIEMDVPKEGAKIVPPDAKMRIKASEEITKMAEESLRTAEYEHTVVKEEIDSLMGLFNCMQGSRG